jgi:hypothetical protein
LAIKAGKEVDKEIIKKKKLVDDIEEKIRVGIREQTRKEVSEQFAVDLDNDWNPLTVKASKEAANQIRKQNSKKREQIDFENIFKQALAENKPKDDK